MNQPFRLLLLTTGLLAATSLTRAADYIIIAHSENPTTTLTKEEVKSILLGNKTKWNSGGLIKLATLTAGTANDAIVQEFTARSADQFDKYWKKQVFTGKGVAPDAFKSDADLIAFVVKTPGAFGYVATGTATDGVKVLQVN